MSTLAVNTITAETGNTVSLASGKTLNASQGFVAPAGHVIQVKHTVATSEVGLLDNGAYSNTGISIAITPTSTSSKILLTLSMHMRRKSSNSDAGIGFRILRDGTDIHTSTQPYRNYSYDNGGFFDNRGSDTLIWLDSPSSTSSTVYVVQARKYGGANAVCYVNSDGNHSYASVMEISG
jgi:hypothetical protein